jgi:hypothetical protein
MKTREERAASIADRKARLESEKAARQFAASPAGQAHQAAQDGETFFQVRLSDETKNPVGSALRSIEEQGWRLEHCGWVAAPEKKALSMTTVTHATGIYLFRRA